MFVGFERAAWVATAVLTIAGGCGAGEDGITKRPPSGDAAPTLTDAPVILRDGAIDALWEGSRDSEQATAPHVDGPQATGDPARERAATCDEQPVPRRANGTLMTVAIHALLRGQPFAMSEPNASDHGTTITPLDLRFYLSEVALRSVDGLLTPVDLVTPAGAPEAYGVHLAVAEDPETLAIRLLAPAGIYTGIMMTLGVGDVCNAGSIQRKAPLGTSSQMTWPHTGYLFLRYQAIVQSPTSQLVDGGGADARVDGALGGSAPPAVIHMGGLPQRLFAPRVRADGQFVVPAAGTVTGQLRLHMESIFRGATTPVDLSAFSGPPGEEVLAGERLRQAAPTLPLFDLRVP